LPDYSRQIVGFERKVPTVHGARRYINFDNAASTPPFKAVLDLLNKEAEWYSSVHRGAGYKSIYSTEKYESARRTVAEFVEADLNEDVVIFTKNTTDSINKISHYLANLSGEIIVYTRLEHHSNELPWQPFKNYCIESPGGILDLERLEAYLKKNRGKVKLVAVTGASNVTGYTPPIYTIAELAHESGAKILVDGAQLVPHRPLTMGPATSPRHLDFLAFSGHKIYAPFGVGALIGPAKIFQNGSPSQVGGGTVKTINSTGVVWMGPPDNEEAGSPNVIGALALAEACKNLKRIGWDNLIRHEQKLVRELLEGLTRFPEVTVYYDKPKNRVGVVSFNINGLGHEKVAAYLARNYGIGVRSGCFCARRYVLELMGIELNELDRIQATTPGELPGMVRVSFGCYNHPAEVQIFIKAIAELIAGKTA